MMPMHIPDGFLDAPTSIGAGVVAVGGLAVCLRRSDLAADDRLAPLAGLTSAFVFAAQMLNFPVAAGTSGTCSAGRWRRSSWGRGWARSASRSSCWCSAYCSPTGA